MASENQGFVTKCTGLEAKLVTMKAQSLELTNTNKEVSNLKAVVCTLKKKIDDQLVIKQDHDLKLKQLEIQTQESKFKAKEVELALEKVKIQGKKAEQAQKVAASKTIITHRAALQKKAAQNMMNIKEEQKKKKELESTRRMNTFGNDGHQFTYLTPQQAHCTSTNGGTFPTDFQGAAAFAQGIASYGGHQFSLSPTSRMPEITPSTGSKRNSTFLAPKNVPPPS